MLKQYLGAVGIITLVVLVPTVLITAWEVLQGTLVLKEYFGMWHDVLLMLVGFWLKGAGSKE